MRIDVQVVFLPGRVLMKIRVRDKKRGGRNGLEYFFS